MTRKHGLLTPAVLTALLAAAPVAHATTLRGADILGGLNNERQLNGIPPIGAINAYEDQGCANHLNYEHLNGNVVGHGEDPSKPGYTESGDIGSNTHPYTDEGLGYAQDGIPYANGIDLQPNAPLHRWGPMDPNAVSMGYAQDDLFGCMRVTGRAPNATEPLTFWAWTGAGGYDQTFPEETPAEAPYTPQQMVGMASGVTTGPNILLWSSGYLGKPTAATITDPSNAVVDSRLVNEDTPAPGETAAAGWFHGGGDLFPVKPLAPYTAYTAKVTWSDQGQTATQTIHFTTIGRANPAFTNAFVYDGTTNQVGIYVESTAPNAHLTVTGPGPTISEPNPIMSPRNPDGSVVYKVNGPYTLSPGTWTACTDSGTRDDGYRPAHACTTIVIAAPAAPAAATTTAPATKTTPPATSHPTAPLTTVSLASHGHALRIVLARAATVRVAISRAGSARTLLTTSRKLRVGANRVALPLTRLRRGRYVATVRISGAPARRVAFSVR